MNRMYKFSLVIPVYNGAKYLHTFYDNIKSQDYENIEIIFVDDGSTDNTKVILSQITAKDSRIVPIFKENGGAASARAAGLMNCTGDYVLFIDVDDLIEPNTLNILNAQLESVPDIVVFGFNMVRNGQRYRKIARGNHRYDRDSYLKHVMTKSGWELCGKLFKKDLFTSDIEVRTEIRIGEDAYVFFQLASRARNIVTINDCLYNYIQYPTSAMHVADDKKADETILAGYYIVQFFKRIGLFESFERDLNAMMLLFYSNSLFRGNPSSKTNQMSYIKKHCIKYSVLKHLSIPRVVFVVLNLLTNGNLAKVFRVMRCM